MNQSAAGFKRLTLISIAVLSALFMLFTPRIPQSLEYHLFADVSRAMGIPNFWNVASNLPFALVGLYGLTLRHAVKPQHLLPYYLFCIGVILVAFGSGYYHYAPSNHTLVWDRLPMTIAFMSLFSVILGDSVLRQQSTPLLFILIALGIASIVYWHFSEELGAGDLRPYALVQFLPMLIIPLILWRSPPRNLTPVWIWVTLLFYLLAKVFEHFDAQIYWSLKLISGHSLKHVAAAIACCFVIKAFVSKINEVER